MKNRTTVGFIVVSILLVSGITFGYWGKEYIQSAKTKVGIGKHGKVNPSSWRNRLSKQYKDKKEKLQDYKNEYNPIEKYKNYKFKKRFKDVKLII